MTCEPGRTYILENCGNIPKIQFNKRNDCNEKNRQRRECNGNPGDIDGINQCASWFPGNFSLVAACQAGVRSGERYVSMCDYLENYVGDQQTISLYGIDCDIESGTGSALVAMQKGDAVKYTVAAVLVVVFIFIIYLLFF